MMIDDGLGFFILFKIWGRIIPILTSKFSILNSGKVFQQLPIDKPIAPPNLLE